MGNWSIGVLLFEAEFEDRLPGAAQLIVMAATALNAMTKLSFTFRFLQQPMSWRS
jgi:hypothetical protein